MVPQQTGRYNRRMTSEKTAAIPVVLILSGNDPSGGAGMAADIQAVTALAAHPAPVLTSLTVQDTVNANSVHPVESKLVRSQAEAILADMPVAAVKIGLLANAAIADEVARLLAGTSIPVVLDPVLVAAGGAQLATDDLRESLLQRLTGLSTLLTPNASELHSLVPGSANADEKAEKLISLGARWVLVKGADADTDDVENGLYNDAGLYERFSWPRLAGTYHGSGCTLAAATAALLARGAPVPEAVAIAQQYTWETLQQAFSPGRGQPIPNRNFN